jgi:hypothetical protein
VRSGRFSLAAAPACPSGAEIPSPYASQLEGWLDRNGDVQAYQAHEVMSLRDELSLASVLSSLGGTPGECAFPIEATVCAGDCISTEPLALYDQALAAPNGFAQAQVLCADDFAATPPSGVRSPALLEQACQEFLWRRLIASERLKATCAAFRFRASCAGVVRAILDRPEGPTAHTRS